MSPVSCSIARCFESSFRGARSANPESRDSGSGPSDHPGMTRLEQSTDYGRSFDLRDQPGQLPHVVKRHDRPGGAQRVVITGPAMAAAVKAEDGHAGGKRAGDAGYAVLDHNTSFGGHPHLRRCEQKQIWRRLAALDL